MATGVSRMGRATFTRQRESYGQVHRTWGTCV